MTNEFENLKRFLSSNGIKEEENIAVASLYSESQKCKTSSNAIDKIKELLGDHFQGWVCMTDQIEVIRSAADLDKLKAGNIQNGEFVAGEKSVLIRYLGNQWVVYFNSKTDGQSHIVTRRKYISDFNGVESVEYEIFWSVFDGVYRPYASRLAGIQLKETKNA